MPNLSVWLVGRGFLCQSFCFSLYIFNIYFLSFPIDRFFFQTLLSLILYDLELIDKWSYMILLFFFHLFFFLSVFLSLSLSLSLSLYLSIYLSIFFLYSRFYVGESK